MDQDFFDDYVTAWTAAGMFDATDEEAPALIDRASPDPLRARPEVQSPLAG